MKVSLLELPARFGEVDTQLAHARALVKRGVTDLLVLPETTFTGYVSPALDFDLTPFAEPLATGVARLVELARSAGCDVVGPVIERDGERCFNTVVGVSADGSTWLHYRKRHPWYPETWATPGDLPWPLVSWKGLQLTCAVCFDVHFLADEAADALTQADVLLFPSAWVEKVDSRASLLGALADRFSLTILNANWGTGDPAMYGQGGSLVVRPAGVVERLETGSMLTTTL